MFIFLIIIAVGVFILWWEITCERFWKERGVPYIRGLPLIGVFGKSILMLKNFTLIFSELHHNKLQKDEPISGFYFLKKPCLIVRDEELIKRILIKDFHSFPTKHIKVNPEIDPFAAKFLPFTKGTTYKDLRTLFTKFVSSTRINSLFLSTQQISRNLEAKLMEEIPAESSKEYDALDLASLFTTDAVSLGAYGVQTECLAGKNRIFIEMSNSVVSFNFRRYCEFFAQFLMPKLGNALRITLTPKPAKEFYEDFYERVRTEREEKGIQRDDFMGILLELMKGNPEVFSKDSATTQIGSSFIAGHGATASLISFALYELSKNPEIQEKLRQTFIELTKEKDVIEYRDIISLKYLDMVFKETMRLYTGVVFLNREFNPDCECVASEGYSLEPQHSFKIPRGIPIFISIYGINRDPKNFSNPHNFDPENFGCSERNPGMNFNLSFGQGPRMCPGYKISEVLFKMYFFCILPKFRIKKCKKTPEVIIPSNEPGIFRSRDLIVVELERMS